jgi:dipeptidase E
VAVSESHVVAFGGFTGEPALRDYVLALSDAPRPKVRFLGTATGDGVWATERFYEQWPATRCEPADVPLFGVPDHPNERLLEADVVVVSGGNTANLLAVWRAQGVDRTLREAWERGVVLTGWSAGAICWFESGVTDSFSSALDPIDGCLGFLGGSMCPHYDSEELRRPVYTRLVHEGTLPPGLAADDAVGLHFAGTELAAVVTSVTGSTAYRVDSDEETRLDSRLLG